MFTTPAPTQTLILPAPAPAASDPVNVEPTLSVPAPTAAAVISAGNGRHREMAPKLCRSSPERRSCRLISPRRWRALPPMTLLPDYRIVTFYGHPHDPGMGIVGEHEIEELADMLREEAANYAAADPSRPVIPALELIATVAQRVPGSDGTYILDTDTETLTEYIDFAAEHGMVVVLDLQVGRGTVAAEIEKVRDLLARPNVHLAIDPEFAVAEGEIPGEYIGSIDAESITYAQKVLAEISATNGYRPKC